jgi:glyoxylase-like metal-dependent hydrolase (beta-lactamase superfamily II)
VHVVNVGYDSTNYYVLGNGNRRLLIDVGFPGTLPRLLANLRRKDIALKDVRFLLATHYHPDHAGIAQELKHEGVRLVVLDVQRAAIPLLKTYCKPSLGYVEISLDDNVQVSAARSRKFLEDLDISGEVVETPGHSDDSISLVLDDGAAFTGDLQLPTSVAEAAAEKVRSSWAKLRARNVSMIYPGHGPARPIRSESDMPA